MKKFIGTAIVGLLVMAAPASAADSLTKVENDLEQKLEQAANQAAGPREAPKTSSKTATVSKKYKVKPTKLLGWEALGVTEDTAFWTYIDDPDATAYGASNCSRYNKFNMTCVGWISGTIYSYDYSYESYYSCDWFQDVWVNRKNQIRTWVYDVDCYV